MVKRTTSRPQEILSELNELNKREKTSNNQNQIIKEEHLILAEALNSAIVLEKEMYKKTIDDAAECKQILERGYLNTENITDINDLKICKKYEDSCVIKQKIVIQLSKLELNSVKFKGCIEESSSLKTLLESCSTFSHAILASFDITSSLQEELNTLAGAEKNNFIGEL